MKAKFVSVWDGGIEIITDCDFNPITKEVFNIDSVECNVECLEDEFVLYKGEEIRDFIL